MPNNIPDLLESLVGQRVSITTRGGANFDGLKVVNIVGDLVYTVQNDTVNAFVIANIDRVDF